MIYSREKCLPIIMHERRNCCQIIIINLYLFHNWTVFDLRGDHGVVVSRLQKTLNILDFCERFNTRSLDPPGRLHSPETSSVFSFLSKSATLFPRILQAKSGGSGDVGTVNSICVCSCFTV